MKHDFDVAVIGLGPAGMAVSIMASHMDLKVCGIEAHKIGGECMNVGCIPSKSLLRSAKMRHMLTRLGSYGLADVSAPAVLDPFVRVRAHLRYINEAKTVSMFSKVHLVLGEGKASFADRHTLAVGGRRVSARRIFICAGTRPALPPVEGMAEARPLTNETVFNLESVPESLIVIGGGAIACEMAQAFSRLGSRVTMVMRGAGPLWREDREAREQLERAFKEEGIDIQANRVMTRIFRRGDGRVVLETRGDGTLEAQEVLAATGRRMDLEMLALENAGVAFSAKGITVNRWLQTSQPHIYAAGDCNGHAQLSHAAMHQGMLALINAMMPWPMRRDYRKFVVPWTIFTEPQISHVGPRAGELMERGVKFEEAVVRHEDYGAAIAENLGRGYVKVLVSPLGRVYAATVVGEGSGEMINEWALVVQEKIPMHKVMLLQHSFPTMSFLNKRASETWMMNRMQSAWVRKLAKFMYRL